MSEKLSTQFGESYDSLMRPTEGQWEYWTLRIAALEAKLETMEKRLEEMRREVRRSAEDIFDAVAAAQEEKE